MPSEPSAPSLAIPGPVLDELEAQGLTVGRLLDRVEECLHEQVGSSHAFVDRVARYLISAGGKRFRPLLVGLTGHLGDPTRRELIHAGAIVELVHLATLYHDDVIDEATARRGTPSANSRWDNTVAILTGDYLFARASALSAGLGVEVTRIMADTLARLCEGQIREVQGSMTDALPPEVPAVEPDVDTYLEVVSGKTASLIQTSCHYGALLSGVDAEGVAAVTRYGWNVGMAFQLSDDVLDIAADHEQSGKTPGTDLREGVRTLPVLLALESDDGELGELLAGALDDAAVDRALALLRASDALPRARRAAAAYVRAAVDELAPFGEVPAVAAMTRLAEYALHRAQ